MRGVTTHLVIILTFLSLLTEHLDVQKTEQQDRYWAPLQGMRSFGAVLMAEQLLAISVWLRDDFESDSSSTCLYGKLLFSAGVQL